MVAFKVKAVWVAAAFIASSPTHSVAAASLMRCQTKDAIDLQDDGTLRPTADPTMRTTYIVDIETGAVRISSGDLALDVVPWIVAQKGDDSNDAILVLPGPYHDSTATDFTRGDLAEAATDFIRIRQWKQQSAILFVRFSLGAMASGTCEPIQ